MTDDEKEISALFTWHQPVDGQLERYQKLRDAAKAMGMVIVQVCPRSADRSAAIRKLREAVMTANAAIALEGS